MVVQGHSGMSVLVAHARLPSHGCSLYGFLALPGTAVLRAADRHDYAGRQQFCWQFAKVVTAAELRLCSLNVKPTWVSDVPPVRQNPAADVELDNPNVEHHQQDQTNDASQPPAAA